MSDEAASIAELIREIHTVNHGWKLARDRFGNDDALAQGLRQLKNRLQINLLLHPETPVVLSLDLEAAEEPLYSIEVRTDLQTGGPTDAAHIPRRVLEEHLRPTDLQRLLSSAPLSS